jgi:hypothetical protein
VIFELLSELAPDAVKPRSCGWHAQAEQLSSDTDRIVLQRHEREQLRVGLAQCTQTFPQSRIRPERVGPQCDLGCVRLLWRAR